MSSATTRMVDSSPDGGGARTRRSPTSSASGSAWSTRPQGHLPGPRSRGATEANARTTCESGSAADAGRHPRCRQALKRRPVPALFPPADVDAATARNLRGAGSSKEARDERRSPHMRPGRSFASSALPFTGGVGWVPAWPLLGTRDASGLTSWSCPAVDLDSHTETRKMTTRVSADESFASIRGPMTTSAVPEPELEPRIRSGAGLRAAVRGRLHARRALRVPLARRPHWQGALPDRGALRCEMPLRNMARELAQAGKRPIGWRRPLRRRPYSSVQSTMLGGRNAPLAPNGLLSQRFPFSA